MMEMMSPEAVMLEQENQEAIRQEAEKAVESLTVDVVKYITDRWATAKKHKETYERQMLANLRQKNGEYDPEKLAEIRSVEQPEIFLNLTDTKCRSAVAWIKDIVIQLTQRLFGIDPTPIPDLPKEIVDQIINGIVAQYLDMAVSQAQQTGQAIPGDMLRQMISQQVAQSKDRIQAEIVKVAKKMAEDIEDQIDDHWVEGGFYKALEQAIDDVVILKGGIVKGPIFRKDRVRRFVRDPQTGRISRSIEIQVVPQYDRRSPFNIFPSPYSIGVDDGYLFDVLTLLPSRLYDLIGIEGYREDEIRAVLREFEEGELNDNWLELSEDTKEGIGQENVEDEAPAEKIYCLELWDEIPGKQLAEWGIEEIEDPDKTYSACVWCIGTHVIKAMLNYDPLGRKPYSKTAFETDNDSFWGVSIPELIADCQQVCNACARSILANIGLGALPMVDLNVDRLAPGASRKVWPGRVFETTDEQMGSGSKPVNYYQPAMVTEQLIRVLDTFSKLADDHSGVPAWAHGDPQVGGGGNTASGLNQLINQAARGIRAVVRNIDMDIIIPCLERHYDYLLDNYDVYGLLGDYKLSAKGTAALLAKEQQTMRKMEFMNFTQNPVDLQLLGPENRRKMLFEVAKNLGINLDESPIPVLPAQQLLAPPQPPQASPETLDTAGNPVVGTDTRMNNPSRPRQQVSTPGNTGGAQNPLMGMRPGA